MEFFISQYNRRVSDDSSIKRVLTIFAVIMVILSAFTLCNVDLVNWNMVWGKNLLECIRQGKIRDFAVIMEKLERPTNYNIALNFSFALWELPLYLVELAIGKTISYIIYAAWYKVLIIMVTIFTIKKIRAIISELVEESQRRRYVEIATILYIVSPIALLASIGQGQVDFLGNFLFVSGILCFVKQDYRGMTLWVSLAAVVKGLCKNLFRSIRNV